MEAHESTRKRLESALPRNHDDHIAEKGFNSLTRYNLVHKFYSHASSDEHSGCESSCGQRVGEAREDPCVKESKKDVILEAQKRKRRSTLLH